MKKLHKLLLGMVGLFALVSFLAPQLYAQAYGTQKHYVHAKEVLEQEYPEFLTAFQMLKDEVKTINSTDKQAQHEAFMRFLPYVDKMADMTAFDTWDRLEGHWTLQREVLFTFFDINLPTADKGHHVTAFNMLSDKIFLDNTNSESIRLLTEDEIMEKHNMSREDAHYLLSVWDKLHRNWPWGNVKAPTTQQNQTKDITPSAKQDAPKGIASYHLQRYKHAKQVLQEEYPAFLTAFQTLQEEIKFIDSSDQQAQFEALMHFFPFLEKVTFMNFFEPYRGEYGIQWDLQKELIVSFFAIKIPTKNNEETALWKLLHDAFEVYVGGGDASRTLSAKDIQQKHNISMDEAQRIHAVMTRLYSNH